MRLFGQQFRRRWHLMRCRKDQRSIQSATLASLQSGDWATLMGFAPGLSTERRSQLQAYGLIPGRQVQVLQIWPVVVVLLEHTELALENGLASQVWVIDGSGYNTSGTSIS